MKLRISLRPDVSLRVVGVTVDRRGPRELEAARALEQARADYSLERTWRQAVSDHPIERQRTARSEPQMRSYISRRQAG